MKERVCRAPSTLRRTTETCQEIPHFANQSDCDSRNFRGKYFLTQSCVTKTDVSARNARTSVRHYKKFQFRAYSVFAGFLVFLQPPPPNTHKIKVSCVNVPPIQPVLLSRLYCSQFLLPEFFSLAQQFLPIIQHQIRPPNLFYHR